MECFTATFTQIHNWIDLVRTENRPTPAIRLGEEGDGGRHAVYVPFDLRMGPEPTLGEGNSPYFGVHFAGVKHVSLRARGNKPKRQFWALVKPEEAETNAMLVRVRAATAQHGARLRRVETLAGTPHFLAVGRGGVESVWEDALIIMRPGDAVSQGISGVIEYSRVSLELEAHYRGSWVHPVETDAELVG